MNRVLVTGATGFIGAAVTRLLVAEGYEVAALIRHSSTPWRLGDLIRRVRIIYGSIDALDSYRDSVRAFKADTVMHLAWHGVAKDRRDDLRQVSVNVCGAATFFDEVVDAGTRMFVGAGSQAEYGPMTTPIDETAVTRPMTLYGAAKLATSVLLSQRAGSRQTPFAWLRLFSVYGPQDSPNTLVSSVIRDLLAGRRPAVTSADQDWDFLYIDDAASAFVEVARHRVAGVFNLASGVARPLRESIVQIRDRINPSLPIGFGEVPPPSGGCVSMQPRIDRLRSMTSWRPTTSFADGVAATVAYHAGRVASEEIV